MIGKTIAHYKIIDKLGEGGMGVVYKAEDLKLNRTVALKFLSLGMNRDTDSKKRFIQEARSASALDHENICTIYEVNETEDEQTFIVMAYYNGETLKEKISSGPLRIDEALTIAVKICQGLQEAHDKGIIHRDIKPENIMITDKGQVKIMDFGLAKSKTESTVTKEGSTLGTIGFMSPEQSNGEPVDKRTDIWSLGVVLYNMLTGQMPFKGDYDQAIVYSINNSEPEPITGLRTGLPVELEHHISKCLSKDPNERYPSAEGLIVDLKHLQKETRTLTNGNAPATVNQKVTTTNVLTSGKMKFILGLVSIILLSLIISIYLISAGESSPEVINNVPRLAVLPFENRGSSEDDNLADGLSEEISVRLTNIRKLVVIDFGSSLQYKNTEKSIQDIGEELNVKYILTGSIQWQNSANDQKRIKVMPRLIQISAESQIWGQTFDENVHERFQNSGRYCRASCLWIRDCSNRA